MDLWLKRMKMTQNNKYNIPWHCQSCHKHGIIHFDDGIDVWLVLAKILEHHNKLSPNCTVWWSYLKTGFEKTKEIIQ